MLEALESEDLDTAIGLLADDAVWINVSLPTVRGKARIARFLKGLDGPSYFRVHFHNIAEEGDVVLTERTDALGMGRFESAVGSTDASRCATARSRSGATHSTGATCSSA